MATQAISELVTTCRCISGCDPKASYLRTPVSSSMTRRRGDHWNGNDVDKSASLSSSHAYMRSGHHSRRRPGGQVRLDAAAATEATSVETVDDAA